MRLDKFVSHCTGLSRSATRRAIKTGGIEVNGQPRTPQYEVAEGDQVSLDGELLSLPAPQYWMLYKPSGVVCANQDSEHPTVLDLLTELDGHIKADLSVAGRLDKDTTGLVLLSDDGAWVHRLISPNYHQPKTYRAQLEREVSAADVDAFAQGLMLRSESRPTRPAELRPLPDRYADVVLSEGRYHQVKRMFAATGNRVLALHRLSVGKIILDPLLKPGEYRPLTAEEIASI